MKRVIRRTKAELEARKVLLSQLLSLSEQVLDGSGDTERRIQDTLVPFPWSLTPWAKLKASCIAAWLHPAGSALMYHHYRVVHQKRDVRYSVESWATKLTLQGTPMILEELYGGEWRVDYVRVSGKEKNAQNKLGTLLSPKKDAKRDLLEGNRSLLAELRSGGLNVQPIEGTRDWYICKRG